MPEYTLTLLIWILPIIFFEIFFYKKKLLSPPKRKALNITVAILAALGIGLDLFFARIFFTFPNKSMTIGFDIFKIPIEEFIFYITGFWFIIYLYVFCDEWFLKKYNPSDEKYARYSRVLNKMTKRKFFIHKKSIYLAIVFLICGVVIKRLLQPEAGIIPGYFSFLTLAAYVPMILFYRVTKSYINWRSFSFSLILTVLISIIWEVTLAIPRGYWGYQEEQMLGIFISPWSRLPIEAVSVWIFCTLVILVYEYLKISRFTISSTD